MSAVRVRLASLGALARLRLLASDRPGVRGSERVGEAVVMMARVYVRGYACGREGARRNEEETRGIKREAEERKGMGKGRGRKKPKLLHQASR